jgi:cell division protein FtsL
MENNNLEGIIEKVFEGFKRNILFVLFCVLLAMIYIWNNHMALKLVTDINRKAKELKELRWDYLTIKSDLMYQSKLTEVRGRADELGLKELNVPPYKINLKKKDYQRQD